MASYMYMCSNCLKRFGVYGSGLGPGGYSEGRPTVRNQKHLGQTIKLFSKYTHISKGPGKLICVCKILVLVSTQGLGPPLCSNTKIEIIAGS